MTEKAQELVKEWRIKARNLRHTVESSSYHPLTAEGLLRVANRLECCAEELECALGEAEEAMNGSGIG